MPRTHLRCAVYCRISIARLGDTLKVDDQEKLCRDAADRRGWVVDDRHIYVDNSRSAWRHDRKRPGWDAMLDTISRGEIDAIVVYHGDRLIRQPWDLELLLRLAREKGIRLASPTGERDLDDPDDQFILRIEAAQACREVDNTSRRMKRHYERLAEQGIVRLGGRGGRAYGFEADGRTIREDDAHMIQEVARRILAGEHTSAICRDLNTRGYTTTTGGPWDHGALKKLMLRPRLAGLLPASRGHAAAAWPAILDRDTWEAVGAVLEHKATGFGYATNARRYLLSGLALCGTCTQPLAVRHNTRGATMLGYGCINPACKKKVHRAVHHLDPYIEGYVIALLNDPKVQALMRAGDPDRSAELVGKLTDLQALRERRLAEFADDVDLVADILRVTIRRIDQQIGEVRAQLAAAQVPTALDGLWGISPAGWARLDLSRRRAAVAALVKVTVLPAGRRGPGFDPRTVRLE